LVIRWNELRGRLELLEIAHGEKLILKNPGKMISPIARANMPADSVGRTLPAMRYALAAADNAAIADALPASPQTRPASRPAQPVYRAIFHDSVRITQNEKPLATGDRLEIDFLPKQGETASPATTQASPTTVTPASAPTTVATTSPASMNQAPITVYWTGPLRVEPLPEQTSPAPPPGQAIVRLFGSPVHLQQETGRIECASLQYQTAGQPNGWSLIACNIAPSSAGPAARSFATQVKRINNRSSRVGMNRARSSLTRPAEMRW
jgi:hypothetical protein